MSSKKAYFNKQDLVKRTGDFMVEPTIGLEPMTC